MLKRKLAKSDRLQDLSRRERQIMESLYQLGSGSAAQIRELIADPPTYTAIRTLLTILEEKGHVMHESNGPRYIYSPVVPKAEMREQMMDGLVRTFFDSSIEQVVSALLKKSEANLSAAQLDKLAQIVDEARREGR
jgi:predicted transcriptional regulator